MAPLNHNCPGSKLLKEARPDYINCPHCGYEIELWTDEVIIRCPQCHDFVIQDRGASCIDWCKHAQECVGVQKWNRLQEERQAAQAKASPLPVKEGQP